MKTADVKTRTPSYDFREEGGTWTVYDCQMDARRRFNEFRQVGLGLNEADYLAAVLNRVELRHAMPTDRTTATTLRDRHTISIRHGHHCTLR